MNYLNLNSANRQYVVLSHLLSQSHMVSIIRRYSDYVTVSVDGHRYHILPSGRIMNSDFSKEVYNCPDVHGYYYVRNVCKHRLVAYAFGLFPDYNYDLVIHHIDGDKSNNSVDNLVAMTKEDHIALHKAQKELQRLEKNYGI